MKIRKLFSAGLIALAIAATADFASAGNATPESIIVMPARKRVVQLAFQMTQCKDIGLVTYNNSPTLSAPLIHVWNGQEWVQISLDDYVQGRFMSGEPKHVFLLGDSTTLPLRMMDDVAWYKDLARLTTLDTTTLINQIATALKFNSHQWKWLAKENGLKIQDENAEKRRYGRWGAPGKEKDLKPTKLENIELPPTAPIADPVTIDFGTPEVKKDTVTPSENACPAPVVKPEAKPDAKGEPKVEAKPVTVPAPSAEMKPTPAPESTGKCAKTEPAAPAQSAPSIDPTSK